MIVNLHTHTARCGHAVGTDREYVETAITRGLTTLGFADHMPFVFPDGYESSFRIPMKLAEDYMMSLRTLREEYKDQITIHIGFEIEYYPLYFKEMKQIALNLGADFLLLSQHYIKNEHPNGSRYMGRGDHDEKELILYADTVLEAMDMGIFTYFAHPELIRFTGKDRALYKKQMRRICRGAKEHELPLEINLLGLREGRHYPIKQFWEIAAQEGCTVVFGSDAHSPDVVSDAESESIALDWVKELGLRYEPCPAIRNPRTGKITLTK